MARYIDADALMTYKFKNDISYNAFCNLVKRLPAADVAPVRHGRWEAEIITDVYGLKHDCYVCSVCGVANNNDYDEYDFCPNCGARMDGGAIGDPMEDDLK